MSWAFSSPAATGSALRPDARFGDKYYSSSDVCASAPGGAEQDVDGNVPIMVWLA
jgi:hypothetical protein